MSTWSPSTRMDAGAEGRPGAGGLVAGAAALPPAGSGSTSSEPDAGAALEDGREGGEEVQPGAARALAQAMADGSRALGESMVLCSVLLTVAIGCLAWSVPSPGASAGLAILSLVLISVEHRNARARFRRAVARAGAAHGLTAPEAERAARALLTAGESATAEEERESPSPRASR
ncbi:hypothetical protein WMF26_31240 [Sorangium sp. So ce185]|uniref:hypothetical protein n=1 Tax=Sorangium sp. So ce185 TaxID=3133287 RepID=UPI003F5FC0FC